MRITTLFFFLSFFLIFNGHQYGFPFVYVNFVLTKEANNNQRCTFQNAHLDSDGEIQREKEKKEK